MELEIIAFLASCIGIGGSLPQIYKIIRTKNTAALSYTTYFMLLASAILWTSYGILAPVYSIIFWDTIAAFCAITVIALKSRNEGYQFRPLHETTPIKDAA